MLGDDNVAGPTLGSLGGAFGLEPLLNRQLAIVSDARLGGRADQSVIAERLLAVSGEDGISVDRKHRTAWYGRMPVRFMLLTNEAPRIADASGALASRFIVLQCTQSFIGKEDHGLERRLLAELPSILLWALEGLARLNTRQRFVQPASAAGVPTQIEDLGSPISAFLRDRCQVGPDKLAKRADLYWAWGEWCEESGLRRGSEATFGRDLAAAVPGLKTVQVRVDGVRVRHYAGVGLLPGSSGVWDAGSEFEAFDLPTGTTGTGRTILQ
jgi:putative DNA primase/helicase